MNGDSTPKFWVKPNRVVISVLALACLTGFYSAVAQDVELGFAVSMGGTGTDMGSGIAVDASGNVYSTGDFSGAVDFDPGPGTANLTSVGGAWTYVQKLDSAGNFVWARAMGGRAVLQWQKVSRLTGWVMCTLPDFSRIL